MPRLSFGSLNLKTFACALALPVILLSTLTIVGCVSTSPGIPHIYVAKLSNNTLRFGYLAICSSSSNQPDFKCASTVGKTAAALSTSLSAPETDVQFLLDLQASISYMIPAISGVTFFLGFAAFTGTMSAVNKDSTHVDIYVTITRILVWTSVTTALTAALEDATSGSISRAISKAKALEILQWMVLSLTFLFAITVHKLTRDNDSAPILPTTKSAPAPAKNSAPAPAKRAAPPPPA